MAELTVAVKGDLMAVEFLPAQTVGISTTVTSAWQSVPPDYELETLAVVIGGGTGTLSVHLDSSLDILDGDDDTACELQSVNGGNEIGLAGLTGAQGVRVPLMADNAGNNAGMLGPLRIERMRVRAIETGGSATVTGVRVVAFFRKRNLPAAA